MNLVYHNLVNKSTNQLLPDPRKSQFIWPVLNAQKWGGLSYVHPYISDFNQDTTLIKKGKFRDPWEMNTVYSIPQKEEWRSKDHYPVYPKQINFINRHQWMRLLGAACQHRHEPWQSKMALHWLQEFFQHNPFPLPPYPPQPISFSWPAHMSMNVYFRVCSWLDAWSAGLFSKDENGKNAWNLILKALSDYAFGFTKLPLPPLKEGNHYLVEHGLAPVLLSALLPSHPCAAYLRKKGIKAIREVLEKNLYKNGGYAERCLPYSRYVSEHLFILYHLDQKNKLGVLNQKIKSRIQSHATYFLATQEPNGITSPMGDGGEEPIGGILLLAQQIQRKSKRAKKLAHYQDPGFAVSKKDQSQLTFCLRGKCLPNYHEHHDVLSILFWIDGIRLIDDPEAEGYGNEFGVKDPALKRILRHHRYSIQSHNIPWPSGKTSPTLKEYGPGYYGAGKWKDLGGFRSFWGGKPPCSKNLSILENKQESTIRATCSFFPPSTHHRHVAYGERHLIITDSIKQAKGTWNLIWKWGSKPEVLTERRLLFKTNQFLITAEFDAPTQTKVDPFLFPVLGKKTPWSSHVILNTENNNRTTQLKLTWGKI